MENDPESFKRALRLSVELFNELLDGIEPLIARQVCFAQNDKLPSIQFSHPQTTVMRDPISPSRRLMATLRFLAAGSDFQIISEVMRIAPNTLCVIIPEV